MKSDAVSNTLGLILAGGRSSRMGVDKATLSLSGKSFLDIAKARFVSIGIDNYVLSSNSIPGAVSDRLHNLGPLGALDAIAHNPTLLSGFNGMIVVPIDMPLFSAQRLQHLCVLGQKLQTACFYESQPMPFYIPLDDSFKNSVAIQIESGNRSIRALMERLKGQVIKCEIADETIDAFFNVNTPEQLQKMEQQFRN